MSSETQGFYIVQVDGEDTAGILLCLTTCLKFGFNIQDIRLATAQPLSYVSRVANSERLSSALHTTFVKCEFNGQCTGIEVSEWTKAIKPAELAELEAAESNLSDRLKDRKKKLSDNLEALKVKLFEKIGEYQSEALLPIKRCAWLEDAIKYSITELYKAKYANEDKVYAEKDNANLNVRVAYSDKPDNEEDITAAIKVNDKCGQLHILSNAISKEFNIKDIMKVNRRSDGGKNMITMVFRLSPIKAAASNDKTALSDNRDENDKSTLSARIAKVIAEANNEMPGSFEEAPNVMELFATN